MIDVEADGILNGNEKMGDENRQNFDTIDNNQSPTKWKLRNFRTAFLYILTWKGKKLNEQETEERTSRKDAKKSVKKYTCKRVFAKSRGWSTTFDNREAVAPATKLSSQYCCGTASTLSPTGGWSSSSLAEEDMKLLAWAFLCSLSLAPQNIILPSKSRSLP